MLDFAGRMLSGGLEALIDQFMAEWKRLFRNVSNGEKKKYICVLYQFAASFLKFLLYYAQFVEEIGNYLREERITDVIGVI